MTFFKEIFQDVDGGFSSKRAAFILFVILFALIALALSFRLVPQSVLPAVQSTQDKLVDLIKWVGGFILGEQASKFAPNKDAQ